MPADDTKLLDIIEIDPMSVRPGGLTGRLEADIFADDTLIDSIKNHGQHTPILVRPHPTEANVYQIVYGRRRLYALRFLERPIKAVVTDLDDGLMVLIQGQENTARLNPSFIEKVNFARQMRETGAERAEIMAALNIDKTILSRMLLVADCVPAQLIEAIGTAPSIGRTRWQDLALLLDASEAGVAQSCEIAEAAAENGSDAAFIAVLKHAQPKNSRAADQSTPPSPQPAPLVGADGSTLGKLRRTPQSVSLIFATEASAGFETWLLNALPDLHKSWIGTHR